MTTYQCDNCDVTATSLDGWTLVVVTFLHTMEGTQPGARMLAGTAPELCFHDVACRDAWCAKAGVLWPRVPELVGPPAPEPPSA